MADLNASQLQAAYNQGRVDILLHHMPPEQKRQWQQAIVRQGLESILTELATPEEHELAMIIQLWLASPADDQIDGMLDYAFDSGVLRPVPAPGGVALDRSQRIKLAMPNSMVGSRLWDILCAIAPTSLSEDGKKLAFFAASRVEPGDDVEAYSAAMEAATNSVERWQLDTAWAILNGQQLPALEPTGGDNLETHYRSRDLGELLKAMSEAQAQQFRLANFGQLLSSIPPAPAVLDDVVRDALATCLDAARRWQATPDAAHTATLQTAVRAMEEVAPEKSRPGVLSLLRDMEGAIRKHAAHIALQAVQALEQAATADLITAARSGLEVPFSLLEDDEDIPAEEYETYYDEDAGSDPADLLAHPGPRQLESWQVEAAWAILNDEDVPPLT